MNRISPIYLDFNASTPIDPGVIEAMKRSLDLNSANPHSPHIAGQMAMAEIEKAALSIKKIITAKAGDIIFTSGATESNNLALLGLGSYDPAGTNILCTNIEHKSVLESARELQLRGATLNIVPVNPEGYVAIEALEKVISRKTKNRVIVSVIYANNEIGTIQPISEISRLKTKYDFLFHVDAAQAVGKIPINVDAAEIDLLTLSSHKLYGPPGIGVLYISDKVKRLLKPVMYGGGQQNGIRPGTLPTFLIAGLGAACDIALGRINDDGRFVNKLASIFLDRLRCNDVSFKQINSSDNVLPGLLSIYLEGVDGDEIVLKTAPWLSISTGSACSAKEIQSSHVLRAIGLSENEARSVIRIGFGRSSTEVHATRAAEVLADAVRGSLRA